MEERSNAAGTGGPASGRPRLADAWTLPNLLSIVRILLTPVFVVLTVSGRPWPAFIIFLVAGATDALDGLAARALNLRSALGLWLDPIGDKVLLTSAFVILTIPGLARPNTLPVWLTVVCVGRDAAIALSALILCAARGRRNFKPVLAGKASTVCQVFLIYLVLYLNVTGRPVPALVWLYGLTAGLTAVSFVQYGIIGARLLREDRAPAA
jgi:cardiolipin synthase